MKHEDQHFSAFIETADLKESYHLTSHELHTSGDADNEDTKSNDDQNSLDAGKTKTTKKKAKYGTKSTTKESHKEKMKVSKKWEILQVHKGNEEESARQLKYYE